MKSESKEAHLGLFDDDVRCYCSHEVKTSNFGRRKINDESVFVFLSVISGTRYYLDLACLELEHSELS